MTSIGTTISAVGYVLAIYGAWRLYVNAAPDFGIGRIPVVSGEKATDFFQDQDRQIIARQQGTRRGFGYLTVGTVLQLVGTVIAGFFSL